MDLYYTLNDSGCRPELFAINASGKLLDSMTIPDTKNTDWEELVYYRNALQKPFFVIGDMGNNRNHRRDLCLYEYDITAGKTIRHIFSYADQKAFPPVKDSLNFDCEAFFRRDSSYYLISKNRGTAVVKVYQLPQDTSAHIAVVKQHIHVKGMVTGCSVFKDPAGKEKIAVLLYGRIFLFHMNDSANGMTVIPYGVIKFPCGGQSEGICWYSDDELRVTNERGKLFSIVLKK